MEPYQILLLILLPPLILGILYGVSHLIAQVGGWAALARAYPSKPSVSPRCSFWNSVQIDGFARYHGIVSIAVTEGGLYLCLPAIFPGHKPIQIPWSEIHNVHESSVLWMKWSHFDVGNPKLSYLAIPSSVFVKFPLSIRERMENP